MLEPHFENLTMHASYHLGNQRATSRIAAAISAACVPSAGLSIEDARAVNVRGTILDGCHDDSPPGEFVTSSMVIVRFRSSAFQLREIRGNELPYTSRGVPPQGSNLRTYYLLVLTSNRLVRSTQFLLSKSYVDRHTEPWLSLQAQGWVATKSCP